MTRIKSYSVAWLAPAMLLIAGAQPLTAQTLERVQITRPTIYVAGPAWLAAGGYIPTKILLKWKAVPNAQRYRISRWSAVETKHLINDWPGEYLTGNFDLEGGYFFSVDWPVDMTSTYSYEVQAGFVDATGKNWTFSAASPIASAKSPPFVAPSNFKHTVSLYRTPGKLRLTFTWDPVPNAQQYDVFFQGLGGRTIPITERTAIKATTLVVDDVSPHSQYNVCIVTVYLPSIRDDTVRSCIEVKLP